MSKGNHKATRCATCGWRPTPRRYRTAYDPPTTDWRNDPSRLSELAATRPDLADMRTAGARVAAGWAEGA